MSVPVCVAHHAVPAHPAQKLVKLEIGSAKNGKVAYRPLTAGNRLQNSAAQKLETGRKRNQSRNQPRRSQKAAAKIMHSREKARNQPRK